MRSASQTAAWLWALTWLLHVSHAAADVPARGLPDSIVAEALADPQPTAFAPADFSTQDFVVERAAGSDEQIAAQLEAGSLEWVRTAAWVVVPRAVLVVSAPGAQRGLVSYARAAHPLLRASQDASDARALVPVVLLSGASYPVRVQALRDGAMRTASFTLRFKPGAAQRGRVLFDARCSPYNLHVGRGSIPADTWLYVGCNVVITSRAAHDSATLELYLLWADAQDVMINAAPAAAVNDGLYVQRITGGSGALTLATGSRRIELVYQAPEPIRAGFVGLGVGPYYYNLKDDQASRAKGVAMVTLYGGYIVNPTMRIVYFNATVLDAHGYMDQGVYLWLEQLRALDERFSLNLLLGAHALIYSRHDAFIARLSAPQGFELVFRDFLVRNRNLTAGAFLYPAISHRSYYNVWLRWGSPTFFGEINYIAWEEPHASGPSQSQSLGVSFGTPVLRFLRFL